MAGGLSLFVSCFRLNVGNGKSIPTGGTPGKSSDAHDELSSLGWKSSGGGGPAKVELGGKSWCLRDDWSNTGA